MIGTFASRTLLPGSLVDDPEAAWSFLGHWQQELERSLTDWGIQRLGPWEFEAHPLVWDLTLDDGSTVKVGADYYDPVTGDLVPELSLPDDGSAIVLAKCRARE